jgi:glutamyl-tRNA synthetase
VTPEFLGKLLQAAGDRLKVAGDILQFQEFFSDDDQLTYDEAGWQKRVVQDPAAVAVLEALAPVVLAHSPFEAASLENRVKEWLTEQNLKIGQVIHVLRLAATGKTVGIGMFETLELLGQERVAKRIEATLLKARA